VLLVASGLARTALNANLTLAVELVVLVLALLWLRTVIHFGLLEEANEVEIGPVIRCPNCGADSPHHTFCGNCGVALAALPRRARPHPAETPATKPSTPGEANPS